MEEDLRGRTDDAIHVERMVLGWPLSAVMRRAGEDWLIQITGGCAPHIGSVSTVWWEGVERKRKTLLLPGHRDDAVSDLFAETLSDRTRSAVTAVCGIHYDRPGREGIARILDGAHLLLEDVLAKMETVLLSES